MGKGTYQANKLHAPLIKLLLHSRECTKLRRTYWSEIRWMAEADCPFVADPPMEIDFALGSLRFEVGRYAT